MSEEYIEEGINGQWTDWKFEAENYKKIYEYLQQENQQLKEIINKANELTKFYKKELDDWKPMCIVDEYDEILKKGVKDE